MFETGFNTFQNQFLRTCCPQGFDIRLHARALILFRSDLLKGRSTRLLKRLLGRRVWLYDLNGLKSSLAPGGNAYAGVRTVPIRRIIGSEGRAADFDESFHPIHGNLRDRWVNMAVLFLSQDPLPLVQLIQVGDSYFVRDGHHRISVARALGQYALDAEVITWQARPPFSWQKISAGDARPSN